MKAITKLLCALLCIMMLCAPLAGCSSDDGSLQEYLDKYGMTEEQLTGLISSYSDVIPTDDGSNQIDISGFVTKGGDVLPEVFIGDWEVVGIYQYVQASDITDEDALARERATGVFFDYNSFSRYGETVSNAIFKVNEAATYADMESFGIQSATLKSNYGEDATITSVEIQDSNGQTCTKVFLVNNETLVAFGAGMNVYTYKYLDSALG